MSDEFDSSEPKFSSFIPVTIVIVSFIAWFGFQDIELNSQRSLIQENIQRNLPTANEAQNITQHYTTLLQDLDTVAKNDDAAKAILNDMFKAGLINDAIRAGLIHVQQNGTNAAGTPAAPDSTGTK